MPRAVPFALALLLTPVLVPAAAPADVAARIGSRLGAPAPVVIDGVTIDVAALGEPYAARAYAPLWVGAHDLAAIVDVLREASTEGLEPSEYHPDEIGRRLGAADAETAAELDLLLSEALLRYGGDVHWGRARPLRVTDDAVASPRTVDRTALLLATAEAPNAAAALRRLPPAHPGYVRLRAALATYRAAADTGAWPQVPSGPKLYPGMSDAGVPALRRRLEATGDLAPSGDPVGTRYTEGLSRAVRAAQARHGLSADGVLGDRTRSILNLSASFRARQAALNMERWRWLPEQLGDRYVMVDIPGFWLRVIEHDHAILEMPIVVGKDDWQTPTFSSQIEQVVFNPRWTVPASIAGDEVIPRVRRDPGYLARHNFRVYAGDGVDPASVDWDTVGPRAVRLVQQPGPQNPLGRIKFELPNPFGVYLHDTSSHGLFQRPVRAFSHGCIRVGNAAALATEVMRDMPQWSDARREALLAGWTTRSITTRPPLPVHVTYQTLWVEPAGVVQIRDDLYDRDVALAKAMLRPRVRARPLPPAEPPLKAAPAGTAPDQPLVPPVAADQPEARQ